jgi:hypothetical protein
MVTPRTCVERVGTVHLHKACICRVKMRQRALDRQHRLSAQGRLGAPAAGSSLARWCHYSCRCHCSTPSQSTYQSRPSLLQARHHAAHSPSHPATQPATQPPSHPPGIISIGSTAGTMRALGTTAASRPPRAAWILRAGGQRSSKAGTQVKGLQASLDCCQGQVACGIA